MISSWLPATATTSLSLPNKAYHGIIIVVRRKTRAAERTALFHLLERAGENGLKNNINFA